MVVGRRKASCQGPYLCPSQQEQGRMKPTNLCVCVGTLIFIVMEFWDQSKEGEVREVISMRGWIALGQGGMFLN